jgi:PAS domain S-box-containing protein
MQPRPQVEITTILFTDLVGSTELMQRVGDRRAQSLFQQHSEFLRDNVVALGGDLVEWTGDGVMATFSAASDALHCAIAVQQTAPRTSAAEPLGVRVGLNAGEVLRQELGSGYFGAPVVIARRLCDAAGSGQILCSQTITGLVAGNRGFRFRDLGAIHLKGIADPVGAVEVVSERPPSDRLPEETLARLIQAVPDIVVVANELGQVQFFSEGAERVLGYARHEILGRPVLELYPSPEEARRVAAAMRDAEGGGRGRLANLRTTFLACDGTEIPTLISGSALLDESGNLIATIGVSKDLRAIGDDGSG